MLDVAGNEGLPVWRLDQWKDRFAERARLGEFGEAPFAVEPVLGQNQNDRFGPRHFSIEGAFPIGAGRETGVLIEVEKGLDKTIRVQAGEQARRLLGVPA